MNRLAYLLAPWMLLAVAAGAWADVEFRDGTLWAEGRPCFVLSTWSSGDTTPEDLARIGLNADFRGVGRSQPGVDGLREHLRRFWGHGIYVIPYLSYGGAGVNPWPTEDVERYMALVNEPGLLAWYIGDDLVPVHLPGMKATADTIHAADSRHPVVADYIADPMEIERGDLRPYLDVACQYTYPVPEMTLREYATFFDLQRARFGDPLWTWIQAFQWGFTARQLRLGGQGPGSLPEPEQVRLMSYLAVSRGVRGLLFFQHTTLRLMPELESEIGLITREIRLLEPYLAAGRTRVGLPTSAPDVSATEHRYGSGVAVSLVTYGETYHRWMDEGVRENVSFEVAVPGAGMPEAVLVAFPQPVECRVERLSPGRVRVTVPRLELAGLVLVTGDQSEIARVRREAAGYLPQVAPMAVAGAAAQVRKIAATYYRIGEDPARVYPTLVEARGRVLDGTDALRRGDDAAAVRASREAMRLGRVVVAKTMAFAEDYEALMPERERVYLKSFHSLPQIDGLGEARPDGEYRWLRDWMLIGPFPLELVQERDEIIPPGFDRPYPPEREVDLDATYDGMAGPVRWQRVHADLGARVDLGAALYPTENAVAYAAATITAPEAMETTLGLGSNDGAKVWVNGELVYAKHVGRAASPNEERIPIRLRAGDNRVLLKVENWGRSWAFYVSVRDPEARLRFAAD